MISNRCARKSLVTNCNSIISKNYLRFLVDSNDYEVNKDTQEVKIFAHKDRLKHFETVLLKENPELKEYKRILIDDISNKGNVGLFFLKKIQSLIRFLKMV